MVEEEKSKNTCEIWHKGHIHNVKAPDSDNAKVGDVEQCFDVKKVNLPEGANDLVGNESLANPIAAGGLMVG